MIEAAAILDGESVAEFLKPLFDEVAARAREDEDVQDFLRMKAERAAVKQGKLSSLAKHRRALRDSS